MIIVDTALKQREAANNPIRVGMIGAGVMAQGIANMIINSVPGMCMAAISNRTLNRAVEAYKTAGISSVVEASNVSDLDSAIERGQAVVTNDAFLIAEADNIDILVEVTGSIEFALNVCLKAFDHKKDVVLMNAELDGTLGPILKKYADEAGVILTACDGDQPGVEMNLYRFVKSIGLTPLMCGNIKGLQDHYRTPKTQEGFAKQWNQNVNMVTSFADGTKVSFEQAIVANGTGMRVSTRGMQGIEHRGHIDDLVNTFDIDALKSQGGVVEYVLGAEPGPGVFVLATTDDPMHREYLKLYKKGDGPLYSFYTPYHLCYFEVPMSIARVALFRDTVLAPLGAPVVDVIATAKHNLSPGDKLDGIGGFDTYGQCENSDMTFSGMLLPMGIANDCIVKKHVSKDQVLRYSDVELPQGRTCDRLRQEQDALHSETNI
jgi:predicted homoserine dehydrogenase-like protein